VDVAKRVFVVLGVLCLCVCITLCIYLQQRVSALEAEYTVLSKNFTTLYRVLETNTLRQTHIENIVIEKTDLRDILAEIQTFNARIHRKRNRAIGIGGEP